MMDRDYDHQKQQLILLLLSLLIRWLFIELFL